jgi:hypothetical protein
MSEFGSLISERGVAVVWCLRVFYRPPSRGCAEIMLKRYG